MSRGEGKNPLQLSDVAPLLQPYLDASQARSAGVVLAVSGGPDSVVLMRFAARMCAEGATATATVATVDHGLRPESCQEASAVAAWAAACGLPHRILRWGGPKPQTRLQERSREARYSLLAAFAREVGASYLLSAHTLDDQAETILMRLARGSGPAGLAGMRAEIGWEGITLARPFLALRKARLVATCRAEGWSYIEDASNTDPRFARARFRRLLPLLEAEGLTAERWAALAGRLRRMEEALEARAAAVFAAALIGEGPATIELDGTTLLRESDAVQLRVVARALAAILRQPRAPLRLERLEALVLDRLRPTLEDGRAITASLGGALIEVGRDRRIVVSPEPPRRRGRGEVQGAVG